MSDAAMMSQQSELILHIGLPKTGTSAIQRYLYSIRGFLEDRQIIYPDTFMEGYPHGVGYAHHLYAHKWGGWLNLDKIETDPDAAWAHLAEALQNRPGRYVLSSERFSNLIASASGDAVLDFICTLARPAKVRIIGYIRKQDILAESFLKQKVKVNRPIRSADSYLEALPPFLDFDHLFSKAAGFVGWDNVMVRVYEREKLKARDAAVDFMDALGVADAPKGDVEILSSNESIHSLTTMVFLRLAERGALHNPRKVRMQLRDFLESPAFKDVNALPLFDAQTRHRIMTRYEDGNARLKANLSQFRDIGDFLEGSTLHEQALSTDTPVFTIEQLAEAIELVQKPPVRKSS